MNALTSKVDICCIGAANVDKIITFTAEPQLEHDTYATSVETVGGVACNVAQMLKSFGQSVMLASVIGNDMGGQFLRSNLIKQDINCDALLEDNQHSTCTYTAFHRPDGELFVASIEGQIYRELTTTTIEPMLPTISQAKIWIFDTSFPQKIYERYIAARASDIEIYIVISSVNNLQKITPLLPYAKMLFGNLTEMKSLSGMHHCDDVKAVLEKVSALGPQTIFATDGINGVHVYNNANHFKQEVTPVDNLVCSNGAGDTFAAAAIHTLLKGGDVHLALQNGIKAAAQRVAGLEITGDFVTRAAPATT
jgi:sugar/nucleoside kinase (ribokinase family)